MTTKETPVALRPIDNCCATSLTVADASLAQLPVIDVSRIRKTNGTPPKVSAYDVLQYIFGVQPKSLSRAFSQLQGEHAEEVDPSWENSKFPGTRKPATPVADAHGIMRIMSLFPRRGTPPACASVCKRLLDHLGASHAFLQTAQEGTALTSLPSSEPQPEPHAALSEQQEIEISANGRAGRPTY